MGDSARLGHFRSRKWERLCHGVYKPAGQDDPVDRRAGLQADLAAWSLVLPSSGCFTHVTAASVYGWQLPAVPQDAPVFVAMHEVESRPRRPELRVSRHPAVPRSLRHRGLPLAVPTEVLLAAARDLNLLDLVIMLDSALHIGHVKLPDLELACSRRGRGAPALRKALRHADGRAESAWESVLRLFHVVCDISVEPQHELRTPDGRFVARGDLWLTGTTVLHEYDGGVHRDRQQHHHDLARERAIGNLGWTRRGYTARDLLNKPHLILREADDSLGRPHEPGRVEQWHALLRDSSLSQAGRARLRKRWKLPPEPS